MENREPVPAGRTERKRLRKTVFAASMGNFVEWYDFAIYGFVATVIAQKFFPSTDATASLLATFAVYAVSFFMRPVGGLIFGAIGDRVGRRRTLSTTILLMAGATATMALLPTYASIGILAPILLILTRCVQGLAAGGEFAGAASFVVEHSPVRRRGLLSSFLSCTTFFAFACGALFTALLGSVMGDAAFESWGWRLAVLVSAPLGLLGFYLRLRIDETPVFRQLEAERQITRAPLSEALRTQGGRMAQLCVFFLGIFYMSYLLVGYIPTYLVKTLEIGSNTARFSNAAAIVFLVACFPLFGLLSDRVGRRPVAILGCCLLIVCTLPAFLLIREGSVGLLIAGQCLLVLPIAALNPLNALFMTELFPTRIRYSASAISYNVAAMLAGGTAPLLATFLVAESGTTLAPAFYATVLGVISLLAAFRLPETYRVSLFADSSRQAAPAVQTDRFSRSEAPNRPEPAPVDSGDANN